MFVKLLVSRIGLIKAILFLICGKYLKSEKPFCIFSKILRDLGAECWGQMAHSLNLKQRGRAIVRQQGLELRAKPGVYT